MTIEQIINDEGFKFKIYEFVCPHIYKQFGEAAWNYFDERLLEVVLWIRKTINMPMTINNWKGGGTLSQRGMRCNLCEEVKKKDRAYLSSHIFGKGVDFNVMGYTAEEVRQWLEKHKNEIPYPIRLEKDKTWVHLDVCNRTNEKIVYFNG